MREKSFLGFFVLAFILGFVQASCSLVKNIESNINRGLAYHNFTRGFKYIRAGRFIMGSPLGEKEERNRSGELVNSDEKQVEVIISKPFEIMATEVTQQTWFDVMENNPSRFKRPNHCSNHLQINGKDLCPNLPVEQVSWSDVQTYIAKLNEAEGLTGCRGIPQDPKGCYRLPTEAEWEYAARGGTKTMYSFGENRSDLKDYAWYKMNSEGKTHPVGTKEANPYGLYDMHGNVWEWVLDYWTERLPGGRDPLVAFTSRMSSVYRGGGWKSSARYLRSANRSYGHPNNRDDLIGFRLVRTL